jgi:uncharacterized membrane protein
MLFAAIAYYILAHNLVAAQAPGARLEKALGRDVKGRASIAFWVIGVVLAFVNQWIAVAIYVAVALMWLVPDSRMEKRSERQAH